MKNKRQMDTLSDQSNSKYGAFCKKNDFFPPINQSYEKTIGKMVLWNKKELSKVGLERYSESC